MKPKDRQLRNRGFDISRNLKGHLPPLSREGEYFAFRCLPETYDLIFRSNLRLVANIALKFSITEDEFENSFQNGSFGLMKAIWKYDPDKGHKLSTYATWWIRQTIIRDLLKDKFPVRSPYYVQETVHGVKRGVMNIPEFEHPAISSFIQAVLTDDVPQFLYLDSELFDGDTDKTSYDKTAQTFVEADQLKKLEAHEMVMILRKCLDEKEFEILWRRKVDSETLASIAENHGLTRERIRQKEAEALRKAKTILEAVFPE